MMEWNPRTTCVTFAEGAWVGADAQTHQVREGWWGIRPVRG